MLDLENNRELDEHIEQYVNGQLSGNDLNVFQARLNNDSLLREEVDFRRNLLLSLHYASAIEVSQTMQEIIDTHPNQKNNNTNRNGWIWKSGLILMIGLASYIGYINFFANNSSNSAQMLNLVDEKITYFEDIINFGNNDPYFEGMNAYRAKDYALASKLLTEAEATDPDKFFYTPKFYIGLSYLLDNKPKQAIPYFQKIIEVKEDFLVVPAQWYLAMAYLKLDNNEKAIEILKSLESTDYEEDAKVFLEFL